MSIDTRLRTISDMLIKGKPAADIGADHALLSIYIIEKNIVPGVIVGELPDGPFKRACYAVENSSFKGRIEVRQGNGLQVLDKGEVENVIIAGMGGETIVNILSCDWEKARSYLRYVFQPMSRPQVLRRELSFRGWPILDERIVKEKNVYYVIISSCPGSIQYKLSALELEVGPVILRTESELKKEYLERHLNKFYTIFNSLINSRNAEDGILKAYRRLIEELEVIMDAGKS